MAFVRFAALLLALIVGATLPAAASADGIDDPPAVVRARLSHLFGCARWSAAASAPRSDCLFLSHMIFQGTDFVLSADGSVETVNFGLEIDTVSGRRSRTDIREEARARARAVAVVASLLPHWRQGPRWVDEAIRNTTRSHRMHAIRVGRTAVLVAFAETVTGTGGDPANDIPPQAYVTVTRSSDLESWNFSQSFGTWNQALSQRRRR